jgi:hypothetical protein
MNKGLEARSLIFRFEILIFDLCGTNPHDDEPREDCFITIDVIFA